MRARIVQAIATPVITAGSAYAAGNALGSTLTFAGLLDGGFSRLISAVLLDKSNQKAAIDLILFNQILANPQTDKSALAISAADLLKLNGRISFAQAGYTSLAASSNAENTLTNIQLGMNAAQDNHLYGQLVCRGTPTYVSTSDLSVILTAEYLRDA